MLPEPRYVVTELKGYKINESGGVANRTLPGISCMVIDRHRNYRLIATYRSEDQYRNRGSEHMRTLTRQAAAAHAARLNG
jgi:hypothetical protein